MGEEKYQQLFLFAAKAGALEGYLFEREKLEPLDNWIDNLNRMYQELPADVKGEVDPVFAPVLGRTLEYGQKVLESRHREKLEKLLAKSSAGTETPKAD